MAAESVVQDESVSLWEAYRRTGEVGARNALVLRHIGLVYQIANRYAALARDCHEDLIQEGCLGLIRAIERFRPEYGVQFSTYAYPVIQGTIRNYLRDRRRAARASGWGELAPDALSPHEQLLAPDLVEGLTPADPRDFTERVLDRLLTQDLLDRLPSLERRIVTHFFYEDLTQREVARVTARSASRISRLLRRALERIRGLLAEVDAEEARLAWPTPSGLQVVSVVDPETGLFGPQHLSRSLRRELARARALQAPLTLALLAPPLDRQPMGPEQLAHLARAIYRQVRVLDHVFRAGEQELALILSLPPEAAASVCRRLLRQGPADGALQCGLAIFPEDGQSVVGLLAAARTRAAR